jgi:sigma-B regulation protein RsbU (phosphoserine phosphatase)
MVNTQNTPLRKQLIERRSKLEQASSQRPADLQVQRLLNEVDAALERMDKGTFGLCESCREAIETERVLADPLVRVCLDCLDATQQRALEQDLELAAKIQSVLLPQEHIRIPGWEAVYRYERAGPVSGDYCDLVTSGENLYFIVGDVSGKGVAASMLMAHLHATFRSLMSLHLTIDEIMGRSNRMFCDSTLPTQYATLVCGKTTRSGEIEICNAGHNPPLVLQGSKMTELKATGLPMGMFCDGQFSISRVKLAPGDTLLLYTDGLTEAMDRTDQEYGAGRLSEVFIKNNLSSPKDIIAASMEDLAAFQAGVPRADDLTVMVIRRLQEQD